MQIPQDSPKVVKRLDEKAKVDDLAEKLMQKYENADIDAKIDKLTALIAKENRELLPIKELPNSLYSEEDRMRDELFKNRVADLEQLTEAW